MRSFAIVGAGAVGSYYGGRLAAAGNNVRFLLRSDYEVVNKKGLVVEKPRTNHVRTEASDNDLRQF